MTREQLTRGSRCAAGYLETCELGSECHCTREQMIDEAVRRCLDARGLVPMLETLGYCNLLARKSPLFLAGVRAEFRKLNEDHPT